MNEAESARESLVKIEVLLALVRRARTSVPLDERAIDLVFAAMQHEPRYVLFTLFALDTAVEKYRHAMRLTGVTCVLCGLTWAAMLVLVWRGM
jgi:hypothetical protein